MTDRTNAAFAGALLALIFLLAFFAVSSSEPKSGALQVATEQHAASSIHKESTDSGISPEISKQSRMTERESSHKDTHSDENSSEFWPSFFGVHLKITDSLLVLFTAVLAWKTSGLDAATRKLWEAGERQIKFIETSAAAALKAANAAERQVHTAIAARLPLLSFEVSTLLQVESPVIGDGPFSGLDLSALPSKCSVVPTLTIKNDGETAADLQIIYLGWVVGGFHSSPRYGHTIYVLPPIPAKSTKRVDCAIFNIVLSDEALRVLRAGQGDLNFYARVEYNDFVGGAWVETATWKWAQLNGVGAYAFLRNYMAPQNYNQKKRILGPGDVARDQPVQETRSL